MAREPSWNRHTEERRNIWGMLPMGCTLPWMEDAKPFLPHGGFSLGEDHSRAAPAAACPENPLSQTTPGDETEPWGARTGSSEERLPTLWLFRASQGQGVENPWSFSAITWLTHWPSLALLLRKVTEIAEQSAGLLQLWASRGHCE